LFNGMFLAEVPFFQALSGLGRFAGRGGVAAVFGCLPLAIPTDGVAARMGAV
jgi:hypothetical protein